MCVVMELRRKKQSLMSYLSHLRLQVGSISQIFTSAICSNAPHLNWECSYLCSKHMLCSLPLPPKNVLREQRVAVVLGTSYDISSSQPGHIDIMNELLYFLQLQAYQLYGNFLLLDIAPSGLYVSGCFGVQYVN